MKFISVLLAAVIFSTTSWATAGPAVKTFMVDTAKSSVNWKGSKIGEDHSGVVNISKGELLFGEAGLQSGEFVINMESIKNTDIENPKFSQKLDAHLKSEDFFETNVHPKSTYKFTNVKDMGNGQYSVTGEMTIRGAKQTETFVVKVNLAEQKLVAVADVKIDRTKYGIMYKATTKNEDEWFFTKWFKSGKDKVINNELEIRLNIVADQKLN